MIFIDTGAHLARHTNDNYHEEATAFWDELRETGEECWTSNFVVTEWLTLLARRTTYSFAAKRAKSFYSNHEIRIVRPTETDEFEAVVFFEKYADQAISFTDCVSFVLMRRYSTRRAFTFDRHFQLAGFETLPQG